MLSREVHHLRNHLCVLSGALELHQEELARQELRKVIGIVDTMDDLLRAYFTIKSRSADDLVLSK